MVQEDVANRASERTCSEPADSLAFDGLDRGAAFGRYTILHELGAGGMGMVYAAYDAQLDRKVALKVLRRAGGEYETRLVREAQAMARLSHPNVVAVFDTGAEKDRLFVAMELIQGATLSKWQQASARSWREVLRMYLEAGRGLAAAHGVGLVHRDFKPDNVLVSENGTVKVTDFGLARTLKERVDGANPTGPSRLASSSGTSGAASAPVSLLGEAPPPTPAETPSPATAPADSPSAQALRTPSLGSPLTEDGALLGTPGYMAPEQYFGEAVDERTDQFAFCVALSEGLYGHKPFAGATLEDFIESTATGRVREPPKGTAVPTWVRRIVLRGLSPEPEHRYPSMQALLDDLAHDPTVRRRRFAAALAAAAAVGTAALIVVPRLGARRARLCSGAESLAAEVWNADVRGRIEAAFRATNVPYAADTWQRTRDRIDEYVGRWTAMHTQVCEATRIRGDQSEDVMTVRMACLERRRDEVGALARVLTTADRDVASKAVQASMNLTDLDACKDVTSLTAVQPEPPDATVRAELRAIRQGLAGAKELLEAGRYQAAHAEAETLVARAARTGYTPVQAEAKLLAAQAAVQSGAKRETCIDEAADAAFDAEVGRADGLRLAAATQLVEWSGHIARFEPARLWSKMAEAMVQRGVGDAMAKADWLAKSGLVLVRMGKFREAADRYREAIAVARSAGSNEARVIRVEEDYASAMAAVGDSAEAARAMANVDETVARILGSEHPGRIRALTLRGYVAVASGDYRTGFEFSRQGVELAERVAPDDTNVTAGYNNACRSLYELGEYREALPYCEQGMARSRRTLGEISTGYVYSEVNEAHVLIGLRRYDDAIACAREALEHWKSTGALKDPIVGLALLAIGRAQSRSGRPRVALASLEEALTLDGQRETTARLWEEAGAEIRLELAEVLWRTGARSTRAEMLARQASDTFVRLGATVKGREADAWLGGARD
jgi:serine/threonine protein kinase/tetratricopeptide (TPR) repeat protein